MLASFAEQDIIRGDRSGQKILCGAVAVFYQEEIPDMIHLRDYIRKTGSLQVVRSEKTRVKSVLGGLLSPAH
jgi:hypothetical protein